MHPERVGPYIIEKKIGAGGMGNVYLGRHETTGDQAAVKVLPAAMAREDGFKQRFSREIDSLRKLKNRHIVQLFQDGTTDDETLYYAMEFVDGPTLTTEVTDRKRLPWREVIELSMQIAAALKAAHDAGIVHRDLKPSNLMLTKDRVIKLTDFGVASLFASNRLTRTGGIVGTAEYMSPEQAKGARATPRSDLYSLGAVMYAMLAGRPPFSGPTANDILQKHQFSQFDKPSRYVPDLPRLLEDLVCQLLEKDPGKRLPDALVVMRRLEQIRARLDFAEQNFESETEERSDPGATQAMPMTPDGSGHQPGPATMVRNMIRDEATASRTKSPVAKFFDNIFVLITLLALVIVFGIWMKNRTVPDRSDDLVMARNILAKPAGPAWLRVRDDLLQPLLDTQALPVNEIEIREMIDRVDQYDFTRSLKADPESAGDADSELQRLIRRAFDLYGSGDPAAGREQLRLVTKIVEADPTKGFLREFLTQTMEAWDQQPLTSGRVELLERLLNDPRLKSGDKVVAAALIPSLESALSLYRDDASVAELLVKVEAALAQLR